MSTAYEIVKFVKPSQRELSVVNMFQPYQSHRILDEDGDDTGYGIYLFRMDDPSVGNIIDSRFAVKMVLPETKVDHDRLYEDLGFDSESIRNRSVHITWLNTEDMIFSDGVNTKRITSSQLKKYDRQVQTDCIAVKMKTLWRSDENYVYGLEREKIRKYIPDITEYSYVPVNNSMLAKAEIPFLIFDKNRGKCFIEEY